MSLLITLEGIDGSGKTTLINNLKKSGDLDLITYSWRDTELGQKIWHLINETRAKGKNSLPSTWTYIFFIFAAFDELNQKLIKPKLQAANKVVIIDRYIDSTFAYQGFEGGLGVNLVQEIAKKTIDLPLPDITFVLDIDPRQAQERLKKRKLVTGEYTNWDNLKLEFHQRIRNHYLELKKVFPERIHIINAEKNEDEILKEVQTIIKKCLPKKEDENNLPSFSRVIVKNQKGELLLVKDKKWGWNLPGGKIEPGETPEAAACREVFEETNLVVKNCQKIAEEIVFYANLPSGKQHWKGYFFQTNEYTGEIKNKGEVEDIKFVDLTSKGAEVNGSSFHFYLEKVLKKTRNL